MTDMSMTRSHSFGNTPRCWVFMKLGAGVHETLRWRWRRVRRLERHPGNIRVPALEAGTLIVAVSQP